MGNKFDDLLESFRLLKEENQLLKVENAQLKSEVSELNAKLLKLDEEQENINLYSRRDCLEFQGIPQQSEENTNELVKRVIDLVGVEISANDISTSHRLPSRSSRNPPPIIVKLTRRCTRDKIYQSKSNLRSYNSSSIGFTNSQNKLYINESLTPRAKELYYHVREFRKLHRFKYAWTKYGKSFLKKDDDSRAVSFGTAKDFDSFKIKFTS